MNSIPEWLKQQLGVHWEIYPMTYKINTAYLKKIFFNLLILSDKDQNTFTF